MSIVIAQRLQVYADARKAQPQRWSGCARDWQVVTEVHLNPTKIQQENKQQSKGVGMQIAA